MKETKVNKEKEQSVTQRLHFRATGSSAYICFVPSDLTSVERQTQIANI